MLIFEVVFSFEVVFQNNLTYFIWIGFAYVLSDQWQCGLELFQLGVGCIGNHVVILQVSPAELGLELSLVTV